MFGIYIHIPFCFRRCPFCDFTLVTNASEQLIDSYVRALCAEIELNQNSTPVTSVFFGGGTPSILSVLYLSEILQVIRNSFTLDDDAEITLETNPEDVTPGRAKVWKKMGINRISLGVQSMDDAQLKRLGRNHIESQVVEAFSTLQNEGIANISADLMFGLENQTLDSWIQTLSKMIALKPKHISTYNLTIEKNTKYDHELTSGKLSIPSDELQATMLVEGKELLEKNGYDPYEISNAALPGFESRHNMLYWTGNPYLGFGVSAHSFQNKGHYRRFWNTKNIPQYIKNIEAKKPAMESEEVLDKTVHLRERFMTGLRLKKGLNLRKLKDENLPFSPSLERNIDQLVQEGFLESENFTISIPLEHIPITNEILMRIFE